MYLRINLFVLLFLEFFALHSVRTTVTYFALRWLLKFVDKVGSTVFYRNHSRGFATGITITKADLPLNFTIFHWRMSSLQPAWPGSTTSVCWHARCWHFCSSISHKTIPSLGEGRVTRGLSSCRCNETALSIGITQVLIIITRVGY